jgi:hypothetical protein
MKCKITVKYPIDLLLLYIGISLQLFDLSTIALGSPCHMPGIFISVTWPACFQTANGSLFT